MTPPIVAFFDLDRTLLSVNSARLWVRSEFRSGRLRRSDFLKAMGLGLKYHLGGRIEGALREAIASMAGEQEEELVGRTRAFFEDHLADRVRPRGRDALRRHRELGHELILLTSATSYLADIVVEELGLGGRLSTVLEVDPSGVFTGRPVEPLCYGPGKLALGARYLQEQGGQLEDAYFYTDSMSDWEMLEAVGNPVAVNPDVRLRKAARKRGWEIVDWGIPGA